MMLNAGGRPAASSTYDANSDRSESPISTLGDDSSADEPLSQIADECQRNTTPRANNTSANDGSKREQMQRSGKRNNPFKLSIPQKDNEKTNEVEERQISPRTSVTQSNTGEVELGLRPKAVVKKVLFQSTDMDSIPEEEGADFQSEVTNNIRHRSRSSSEDDFFCDEPLDRPPSSYQDKGDPLDLSQHSVPDYLASIDSPSATRADPSASDKRRVGFKRKDSANFFLDDSAHADIEANPSCSPRSDRSDGSESVIGSGRFHSMGGRIRQSMAARRRKDGRRAMDDSNLRTVSLTGRDMMSTRLDVLIWENNLEQSYVEAATGKRVSVKIPSWSKQDRFKRAMVIPKRVQVLFGSSIFLGLIFFFTYLIPEALRSPEGSATRCMIALPCFIIFQIFVTLITAIPGEDSTNKEINRRVNASILIAMTLYPCLGLWIATRTQQLEAGNIVQTLGIDHLWKLQDDESGLYQWGYIFPFFFWSTSACILVRDSHYAFTLDRQGVVSDEQGKAMTALFRRNPSFVEKWTHRITRYMTFSLWSLLPTQHRPAGGGGRFAFQLIAPFVLVFFYVGWRFMVFAIDEMKYILGNKSDYSRLYAEIDYFGEENDQFTANIQARFVVWTVFSVYCIVIRSIIGTRSFLSYAIHDPQSFKKRWITWPCVIVESKRRRVLWAFRGLAYNLAPFYLWKTGSTAPSSFLDWSVFYLYISVYVSFFMEGAGALFFGLSEAQKGCKLQTPFPLFTELWFWGAFNAYLQPMGSLVNVIVFFVNKEYRMKLRLREIFSSALLYDDNNFRFRLPKAVRKESKVITQQEKDERLDEWIETWRRKRLAVGRDDKSITIKTKDKGGKIVGIPFLGEPVFLGTCFPTRDEWLYMRDHYDQYIPLKPWEKPYGPEKFIQWFPSYREEIMTLLSEPYDFNVRREVWMFGYGSLISPDCPPAGLTGTQKKLIIPYWLKKQAGYRRVWNYRHGSVGINAFGLEKVDQGATNIAGCLYKMDYEKASDLFSFREEGYELLLVDEEFFEPMHPDYEVPKGIGYVWICGQPISKCGYPSSNTCTDIACKRHNPTADSPILQSYLDTIIEGALRYATAGRGSVDGMNYAAAFLSSIAGWSYPWYNDRLLAGRPWSYLPNYEIIDGLLASCPTSRDAFVKRCRNSIEPASMTRTAMLEAAKEELKPWADSFYPKAGNFTDSRLSTRSRYQSILKSNTRRTGSSYADRMYQKSMVGSGAYSSNAQNRMIFNQSMIGTGGAGSTPLLETIPSGDGTSADSESPRRSSTVTWLLNVEDDSWRSEVPQSPKAA